MREPSEFIRGLERAQYAIRDQRCIGHCANHGALCHRCDALSRAAHAVALLIARAQRASDGKPDHNPDCADCRKALRKAKAQGGK